MPKRSAVGTSLGSFSRSAARAISAAIKPEKKDKPLVSARAIEALEGRLLMSTTWFVSTNGNDGGSGGFYSPFRSIQRAANVANWGDTVEVEGGTYHETVTPAHSGVTFTNYNGQNVTVSGADQVGGFWQASGNIYEANLSSSLGEGNNQVFVDGQLMNEARWPNTSLDPSHPNKAYIQSYSGNTIYDSALNQPNGYWAGARINITPGNGWVTYTGYVNNSGPGWVNISGLPGLSSLEYPGYGTPFFIYGKYNALDTAGEYYIDGSNHLYLWDPQSNNANWHDVEVKHREWAFNLANVSNTTLNGINIFAASIHTGYSSSNTVINHMTALFTDQLGWISNGWSVPEPWGIEMLGANSTLENSVIAYSAGDGVYIGASNCTVTNNTIHDVDYGGIDAAGVRIGGQYASVTNNWIYNTGRDGINFQAQHAYIVGNVVHDAMLQTTDGGGIYTANNSASWSTVAYNTVYNVYSGGWGAAGIFLDNSSSNITVHNNNVYNVNEGLKINYTGYNNYVYSNQFAGNWYALENNGNYSWGGSQFYNNAYYGTVQMGSGASQWSNSYSYGSPPPSNIQVPSSPSPTPTPTPTPTSTSSSTTYQGLKYNSSYNVGSYDGAVGSTHNGSWVEYNSVNFGTGGFTKWLASIAVGSGYQGQKIVLHLDSLSGATIGTLVTSSTGSWTTYNTQSTSISKVTGVHNLYIQFVGGDGIADLLSFQFA